MKRKKNKNSWWKDAISGCIIGFINGFLGSGGGMIAVPILENIKKMDNKKAHITAIAIILPLSVISAIIYSFNFNLDWVLVGILCASVTVGGVLGSIFLKKLSGEVIRIIFAVVMVIAGVRIFICG